MRANGTALKHNKSGDPMVALSEDISAIKRDLGAVVRRGGEVVSDRATHLMNGAADSARQAATRARERAVSARDQVGEYASERPFTTIAVAALSGAVIAGLIGRTLRR